MPMTTTLIGLSIIPHSMAVAPEYLKLNARRWIIAIVPWRLTTLAPIHSKWAIPPGDGFFAATLVRSNCEKRCGENFDCIEEAKREFQAASGSLADLVSSETWAWWPLIQSIPWQTTRSSG